MVENEISAYLKENGITQTYVAGKANIKLPKLNMALRGKRKLTIEEYSHICWALEVNVNRFLKAEPPQ